MIWPFSWFRSNQDRCLYELDELKHEIAELRTRVLQIHQAVAGVTLEPEQKWVPDTHYGHVETVNGQRPEPSEKLRELTRKLIEKGMQHGGESKEV